MAYSPEPSNYVCAARCAVPGGTDPHSATIDQPLDVARKSAIELEFVLWRRAQLHMLRGDLTNAERDLRETLKVARGVGSAVYELRALNGLVRLAKGGREEAGTMLAEIYNRFSEGFDTADLKDAKALLKELST